MTDAASTRSPHLICCHSGCSRRVAQFPGSYTKRATTCRRHRPDAGYELQPIQAKQQTADRVAAFVNTFGRAF